MRHPARSVALGGVLIAAVLGFLIYQGISSNLVYYITPSELLAKGASANGGSFRLGGQVQPHSVHWNGKTHTLEFLLRDSRADVRVVSHGIPPELFRAGIGCVVEGTYASGLFDATNLMIKHSSTYRAPKPGNAPIPEGGYANKP